MFVIDEGRLVLRMLLLFMKGLHWETCLVSIDDIVVVGKTFDEHIKKYFNTKEK